MEKLELNPDSVGPIDPLDHEELHKELPEERISRQDGEHELEIRRER
jgi:hypothetical protein